MIRASDCPQSFNIVENFCNCVYYVLEEKPKIRFYLLCEESLPFSSVEFVTGFFFVIINTFQCHLTVDIDWGTWTDVSAFHSMRLWCVSLSFTALDCSSIFLLRTSKYSYDIHSHGLKGILYTLGGENQLCAPAEIAQLCSSVCNWHLVDFCICPSVD